MTVVGPAADRGVICQWFDGADLKNARFEPEVLEKIE